MPGPPWDDDPRDLPLIGRNAADLLASLKADTGSRALPQLADVLDWHCRLYDECRVPVSGYLGHLRGDAGVPDLVGYEVGVGPVLPDGLPEKVGVWSAQVESEATALMPMIHAGLQHLDALLPIGQRPRTVDELHAVVALTAVVHGEWVRIHPFVNGNGRSARTWAAFIALRYSLPVFITSKPRPGDIAYARAARESMGRPPDFRGNHDAAISVFAHMLSLALLP